MSNQEDSGGGATIPLMWQHCPDQRDDRPPEDDTQDEDIERGLTVVPGGTVHHQRQLAVGEEGKQDVKDVLRGEQRIVQGTCNDAGLGFECGISGKMQRDLSVECGFGLKQC